MQKQKLTRRRRVFMFPPSLANRPLFSLVSSLFHCCSSHSSYQAMHRGHADHKREQVVDHRVEAAVAQEPPRQVCHALQLVVDVQLRRHQDEAERVHESL